MSFPAATNSAQGSCFALSDVCKTPIDGEEKPIAYPNTAMLQQSLMQTLSQKVFIVGKHAATVTTEISMSSGDEAGEGGGVVSGTVSGPCKFKTGSRKVFIEGHGAAYLGSMTAHNNASNSNMPVGTQDMPSQKKVMIGPG